MNRIEKFAVWIASLIVLAFGSVWMFLGAADAAMLIFALGVVVVCLSVGMNVYLTIDIMKPHERARSQ